MTRSYEIQASPQDLPIPITVNVSDPDPESSDDFDEELTFSQRASIVRRVARAEVADEVAEIRDRARRELAVVEAGRAVELDRARERARVSIKRSKMLSIATGVATSVLAMVLCVNVHSASLDVDSGSGLEPTVVYQLGDWSEWASGGSAAAVPEPESDTPATRPATRSYASAAHTPEPAADSPFSDSDCGDPHDPLNFCL